MALGIVGCDRIKFGFEPTSVRLHVALQIRRHDLEGVESIKRREGGSTTPQLLSARPSPTPAARSRKPLSRLLLIDDAERRGADIASAIIFAAISVGGIDSLKKKPCTWSA